MRVFSARDVPCGADFVRFGGLGERKRLFLAHAEDAFRIQARCLSQDPLWMLLCYERQLRAVLWRCKIGDGEDAGSIPDQLDQFRDDA